MPISTKDVERMASLARLNIDQETKELFAKQFADIINYMDILAEVDTSKAEAMYSPALHATPMREDEAKQRATRQEVLSNAPQTDGQYFVVPRIV